MSRLTALKQLTGLDSSIMKFTIDSWLMTQDSLKERSL
jgi:hypothetical protein